MQGKNETKPIINVWEKKTKLAEASTTYDHTSATYIRRQSKDNNINTDKHQGLNTQAPSERKKYKDGITTNTLSTDNIPLSKVIAIKTDTKRNETNIKK